jgi:hypothetical protein
LSIDSTALNSRWNGHLTSATSMDGHNWMFPIAFEFFEYETKKLDLVLAAATEGYRRASSSSSMFRCLQRVDRISARYLPSC